MDLRQLRYFLTIGELGSYSKAASTLGIAQPALSRQMLLLEQELGARLFYRHGRGVSLTGAGSRFRTRIEPVMVELELARSEVMSDAGSLAGTVSLAMPPSFCSAIGARLTAGLLRDRPELRLHILEGFTGHINEWLVAGRVDLAIVNGAASGTSIRMEPLVDLDLFLVAPSGTMAETGPIRLDELARLPLILPGRHHGLRRELDAAALRAGVTLRTVAEVDALAALAELVVQGSGATVLPPGALPRDLATGVVLRRIVEPAVRLHFMLAYPTQRPETPATRELGRTLRTLVDEALADGRLVGVRTGPAAAISARHS